MQETEQIYKISAYDMFFFGTGRPFTMEDESWTKGVFPPFPSTIYGFLRSVYFENNIKELKNANTDGDPTKEIQINAYTISLKEGNKETILYPIPFGHVKSEKSIEALQLKENDLISNNNQSHILVVSSDGKKETLTNDYYISKKELEKYLIGKKINTVIHLKDYITKEVRIGIATNTKLRNVEEGKLYRIEFNHLVNALKNTAISFQIALAATSKKLLPNSHARTLGGESKKAILTKVGLEDDTLKLSENKIENDAILYFYTPLILEDLDGFEKYFKIQTIANDNFEIVSGWDIQKRKPKMAKYVYPAGTVFFIQFLEEAKKQEFINNYPNYKIGEQTHEGFGCFLIGNQPTKTN